MRDRLQMIFVYSLSYYFFAYFRFVSTSFSFMKLSSSFVVYLKNISHLPSQIYAKDSSRT